MRRKPNILTGTEIKHFCNLESTFPECRIKSIKRVTEYEFRECLGPDFEKALRACLANYDNCKTWQPGETVAEGDYRIYKQVIYVALVETSNQPPLNTDWEVAPKFDPDKDCGEYYEDLWCEYLAEYLGWCVLKIELPHLYVKIGASGFMKAFGQNFEAGSSNDFKLIEKSVDRNISMVLDNMVAWMKEESENTDCFDMSKIIAVSCCGECGYCECKCDCETAKADEIDPYNFA